MDVTHMSVNIQSLSLSEIEITASVYGSNN